VAHFGKRSLKFGGQKVKVQRHGEVQPAGKCILWLLTWSWKLLNWISPNSALMHFGQEWMHHASLLGSKGQDQVAILLSFLPWRPQQRFIYQNMPYHLFLQFYFWSISFSVSTMILPSCTVCKLLPWILFLELFPFSFTPTFRKMVTFFSQSETAHVSAYTTFFNSQKICP